MGGWEGGILLGQTCQARATVSDPQADHPPGCEVPVLSGQAQALTTSKCPSQHREEGLCPSLGAWASWVAATPLHFWSLAGSPGSRDALRGPGSGGPCCWMPLSAQQRRHTSSDSPSRSAAPSPPSPQLKTLNGSPGLGTNFKSCGL